MPTADKIPSSRRYDLDALRASAMLLGIVFHAVAILSIVHYGIEADLQEHPWMELLAEAIHGFRMPLFFLMSGFFSAMLWQKRGLRALLKHRFYHVLLPFVIGMCTIQPLTAKVADLSKTMAQHDALWSTSTSSVATRMPGRESDQTVEVTPQPTDTPEEHKQAATSPVEHKSLLRRLVSEGLYVPSTGFLWFLWYLWWLILGFAALAWTARSLPRNTVFHKIFTSHGLLSRTRYFWLIPLTMLLQAHMGFKGSVPSFGPDTFQGFIPMPHVFAYYALFFGMGVWYFNCDDVTGYLGRWWWGKLPLALLVVFPLAMDFSLGKWGMREHLVAPCYFYPIAMLLQALYAWLMTFALMGMFRALLSRESALVRYLSDASYWLYLAHLPLLFAVEVVVWHWSLSVPVKLVLTCALVTGFLLLMYEKWVRYTWLGVFLNGPRKRPQGLPGNA